MIIRFAIYVIICSSPEERSSVEVNSFYFPSACNFVSVFTRKYKVIIYSWLKIHGGRVGAR